MDHPRKRRYSDLEPEKSDEVSAAEALALLTRLPAPDLLQVALPMSDDAQHPIVAGVSAVSRLPIVTNAVRYYELQKRNYASFNYAAEFVEKAAVPVFNKIEVNLNSMHKAKLQEARHKKLRVVEDKGEIAKRLKFCLHLLKLANDTISNKVGHLQEVLEPLLPTPGELTAHNTGSDKGDEPDDGLDLTAVLSAVQEEVQELQTEIVTTVKKIIHVISNFRPLLLLARPETGDDALKLTIREIILGLPSQTALAPANDKVLAFAKESLEMILRLTTVFNEQLKKAETWVDGSK